MRSHKIFRIFDIDVKLHYSWWFIFALLAWSLATHYFPQQLPNLPLSTHWAVGIVAALFLFISVLLHELSHSLVAKAKNIKVESITLFFFGGVAGITKEDMKPFSEFIMAIAGPLFSLILAGLFYLLHTNAQNPIITVTALYLAQLNLILAIFNLVPGFPLDGGRAFRAILYAYYKDLKKATKIAATVGKLFAGFLIIVGIFGLTSGYGANGVWLVLLGGFLYLIANVSYEQVVIKETLSSIKISHLMKRNFPALNPESTFTDFLKKYKNAEKTTFLVRNDKFTGILDLRKLTRLPPKLHAVTKIKQLSLPLSQIKTLDSKQNAYQAFKTFAEQDLELLPITEKRKFVAIIERNSLLNRLMSELKFGQNHHKLKKH